MLLNSKTVLRSEMMTHCDILLVGENPTKEKLLQISKIFCEKSTTKTSQCDTWGEQAGNHKSTFTDAEKAVAEQWPTLWNLSVTSENQAFGSK